MVKNDVDPRPFVITSATFDEGVVTLTWNSHEEQSYVIEYTTNLLSPQWITDAPPVMADAMNTTRSAAAATSETPRFYRVRYLEASPF